MRYFEKVSPNNCTIPQEDILLPKRATKGSAGYDFFAATDIVIQPNETITIPTGIRVKMEEDEVLLCMPRSGLGFKYGLYLENTIGVIDSDYYNTDNEGHIHCKMTNPSNTTIVINKGQAFMQGVFVKYLVVNEDDTVAARIGGFGSTTL